MIQSYRKNGAKASLSSLGKGALKWAGAGFPVFPCEPGGKTPLTKCGFKDATADKKKVRRMWLDRPDANIGLVTGDRSDLLVLDMMMPKKSGFLVLERLKGKDAETRSMPCIMITANEGGRHRAYAEMLGVEEYIRKPFAMDKLVGAVDRLLGAKPAKSNGDDG